MNDREYSIESTPRVFMISLILICASLIEREMLGVLGGILLIFIIAKYEGIFALSAYILPIILIGLVGLIATFAWGIDDQLAFLRSAFYFAFTSVFIILGIAIGRSVPFGEIIIAICLAGSALAVYFLYKVWISDIGFAGSRYEIRSQVSQGYLITVLALAIVVSLRKLLRLPSSVLIAIIIISFAELYFSGSRTGLLLLLVVCASTVASSFVNKNFTKICIFAVSTTFMVSTPLLNDLGVAGFASKFDWTGELVSEEYLNESDVNLKWRGYETARTFSFVRASGDAATIIGLGWGAQVPLGLSIDLGGEFMDEISLFHNIYANILLRAGYLGIALYFLQIAVLSNVLVHRSSRTSKLGSIFQGMLITGILVGPAISGFYGQGTEGALLALFIGLGISYFKSNSILERDFKNQKLELSR